MSELLLTVLIVVGALVVSCLLGWPVIASVLGRIPNEDKGESVLRGGTYIGLLERAATTGSILAGQPALIAIVVAIKGFGRFDQLKGNPVASEKFTIGTLLSLTWATAVGALGAWLIAEFG